MPVDAAIFEDCLADGKTLTVRVFEPPLGEYAARINYGWRAVRAPLLAGSLRETSLDRFFVGEVDGVYAGSMTYATPRDTRDVAVLGFVWTEPAQRRKGVARALLGRAQADFLAGGGLAMYLCTVNPHAFELYARNGFRPLIGDGMRFLAPGHADFDRTFHADAGPATIRPVVWGDLARAVALYNRTDPDWLIKDYPRRVFRDTRFERHFIDIWKPASEGRGHALALATSQHRLVGVASLVEVDSFAEQHVQVLDFWACRSYLAQLPELLDALITAARARGAEIVQALIAEPDREKRAILDRLGFAEEVLLRDRLRVGEGRAALAVCSRRLEWRRNPVHAPWEYYGAAPRYLAEAACPEGEGART